MSRAKATEYFGQRLKPGQADALQRLYDAIQAAIEADPQSVPCVGVRAHQWTDPHPSAVRHAKVACQSCPLLRQCGSYAREFQEPAGVWGGKSRGTTNYQQTTLEGVTK